MIALAVALQPKYSPAIFQEAHGTLDLISQDDCNALAASHMSEMSMKNEGQEKNGSSAPMPLSYPRPESRRTAVD